MVGICTSLAYQFMDESIFVLAVLMGWPKQNLATIAGGPGFLEARAPGPRGCGAARARIPGLLKAAGEELGV